MNKAYNIIWNHSKQAWEVASEFAKGHGFVLAKKTILAAAITATIGNAFAAPANIGSGVVSSGDVINSGEAQTVYSGGSALNTTINSGGNQNVNNGGYASNATVNSSGSQNIGSAGSATGTIVNSGGFQRVSAGGVATGTQLSGGAQNIYSGGSAIDAVIHKSGVQNVLSGATASNTVINSGGIQRVSSGGMVSDTTINSSGAQNILSDGRAENTTINSGGNQNVSSGGNAVNTTINSGGNQHVSSGGSAVKTEIYSGGKQTVYSGGLATSSQVMDGGALNISGGSATSATVFMSGKLNAYSGNVSETELNSGGRQYIYAGASATNTVAHNEGREYIMSGGVAKNTVVNSGGLQTVNSSGSASSTIVNDGGLQVVSGGGAVTGTVVHNGGSLRVDNKGQALNVSLGSGASLLTSTGATVNGTNALGSFSIANNHAKNMLLENGGLLAVTSGGTATDTLVNAGGRLRVEDGGVLSGTTTLNDGSILAAENIQNDGHFVLNINGDYGLKTNFTGQGELSKNNAGTLTLTGNVSLADGINLNEGGLVIDSANFKTDITTAKDTALTLTGNSHITGNISNADLAIFTPGTSVNGNVDNSGTVVLSPTPESTGNTLTVENYTGASGSVISMGGVLQGDNSLTDKLVVKGNTSGESQIVFNNANGTGAQTLEGINLISVGGNSDATFSLQNRVVAGEYDYVLQKGNVSGSDTKGWYLTSHLTGQTSDKQIRPESGSYASNMQLANTLFSMNLQDRAAPADDSSMWMRVVGGHSKMNMADGQNKTTVNRYVQQIGGDIFSLENDSVGDVSFGLMGGYANAKGKTRNQLSGHSARNSIDGYSVGIYGTWYQNGKNKEGAYADSWLQYNWFDASVKGDDLATERYDINGFTGSVEGGYNLKLSQWNKADGSENSFWLQPHMQATWMGVNPDSHVETNGTKVNGRGENNVQTKLGVKAFWDINQQKNNVKQEFRPYIEANWIYNTEQYGASMNGHSAFISGTRNIGEARMGVVGTINDKFSVNASVTQQIGGKGYSDTQGVLSVKYHF